MFHCRSWGILTWYRGYRDQPGGASRKRPFHCTSVGLKPAITPNVGNSGTQFICVGVCVRANPCLIETLNQARGIKGSLCIRNASNFISQNLLMFGISLQFSKYWMKKVDSIDLWRQTVPLKKKKKNLKQMLSVLHWHTVTVIIRPLSRTDRRTESYVSWSIARVYGCTFMWNILVFTNAWWEKYALYNYIIIM